MLNIRKWLVILLDLCLMFSIVPIKSFAEETQESDNADVDSVQTASAVTQDNEDINVIEVAPEEEIEIKETQQQSGEVEEKQEVIQNAEEEIILLDESEVKVNVFGDSFANKFANQLIAYELATENNINSFIVESDENHTLNVGSDSRILVLLSHMVQSVDSNYCDWTINFNFTGLSLDEVTLDVPNSNDKLTYIGLGDAEYPFSGKFTGNIGSISSKNTIFKAVSTATTIQQSGENYVNILWRGSQDKPILADKVVVNSANSFLNMPLFSSTTFSPYMGELTGDSGQWTIGTLNYSGASNTYQDNEVISGNLGLDCNHKAEGTKIKITEITTNNQIDLRGSENVGGLVGQMNTGASLEIANNINLNLSLQAGASSGGIVGCNDGGIVTIDSDKNITVAAVITGQSAGGLAGNMTSSAGMFIGEGNIIISSSNVTGSSYAGGLYGECYISGAFNPLERVTIVDSTKVSGNGANTFCGGIFGKLELTADGKCEIQGTESIALNINSILAMSNNNVQYGGIAGTYLGDSRKNSLIVNRVAITSKVNEKLVTANYPKKIGGLVAVQGNNITIDAKNSTVILNNPKTPLYIYGIGGLCTDIGDGSLLIADGMQIVIDSFVTNQGSSGVAATTGKGTIIYLKNFLDLSQAILETSVYSGQIVGKQDCSLVYAPGVHIKRLNTVYGTTNYYGLELDDIGNYGEVYRIPNFLTVNETYETTLPYISKKDSSYVLSNEQDYACFALAWQSRGYFPTVTDIKNSNWDSLKSSTIYLSGNIDLRGTGVGGLTRDAYDSTNSTTSATDVFTGTLYGDGNKITLDIGASNVANDVAKGDGRIYWHNATGLFAVVSSQATISNLLLDGNIRLSNARKSPMYSGAISAIINGDRNEGSTFNEITSNVICDALVNGNNQLYLGGVTGVILSGTSTIDFSSSTINTVINISHSGNGNSNHIGGVVGAINENASVTLTFGNKSSATNLEGEIVSTGSVNNIHCGSVIGTIFPSTATKRIININNLIIKGYSITGSPSERMGGLLGGIWANAEVTINGLETSTNSTLTSSGTAEVGGLVYRASGKWIVNNLDISKLTINANNAKALGLIVCHGETYNEYFNGSTKNTGALYLEMASNWETGYIVPTAITYVGDVFDEFVAFTANRTTDGYDITRNGGGVISLKTNNNTANNNTVNMTYGDRNTYYNRTTIGQNKQTNKYSRYYYNLKYIMDNQPETNDGLINTPEELLIWSVCKYSDSNIRKYFTIKGIENLYSINTVGGSSQSAMANFEMDGYSYYPIDIINQNLTINYANVKFFNVAIEEKENGNKSTLGDDDNHSQHYMMHCALFNDFRAENINENKEYTLTVNFAGTIGFVNNGSGSLLCGNVKGEFDGVNTTICKVVLADKDESSRAITLNGVSVGVLGNYCPVLINSISSYTSLSVNYLKTAYSQTMKAGSSLIGDVGGLNATSISIAFYGTIKLSETGVFTKALFLNSLRYSSGSATYNFYKSKDYSDETYVHEATYGRELSTSVEYLGKQGCYYDGYGVGYFVSFEKNFDSQNDFKSYLPYVALSPANKDEKYSLETGWHEIAVNVLSDDITNGCGTYGHPYVVNGNLLKQIANFINTGIASNGWKVNISNDDAYHASAESHDVLLTYKNGSWYNEETLFTEKDIHEYLRTAYYVVEEDIEIANFNGIGTRPDCAFKGVIIGTKKNDNSNPTITLTSGSSAFIKYSYGSVVKNLNIAFKHENNQSISLSWNDPGRNTDDTTKPQQSPSSFFGGVIGSVLGGDNIIDNVNVYFNYSDNNALENDNTFNINLSGANAYLIPVGGYIGVINGGGVIFRGSCEITDTNKTVIYSDDSIEHLYNNAIIGRVLGGYAFYESAGVVLDNGDKNYKINNLDGSTNDLSWDGTTLTINNNQGLLILSAIISSGAGSSDSNAYKYGVARKARYTDIGSTTLSGDYEISKNDKENQTSYLSSYVSVSGTDNTIRNICTSGTEGININIAKDDNNNPVTLNMSGYGNGYRGLSARYVSNAAFKDSTVEPYIVVMRVKTFDGQNSTIGGINMDVKEYTNDDFHVASMGGIFNIVWTKNKGGGTDESDFVKNIILLNCNVKLCYITEKNEFTNQASISTFTDVDGLSCVAVGGIIGSASDVDGDSSVNSTKSNYLFSQIHINGGNIIGPNSAGGLIGATAMTNAKIIGFPGKLLSNSVYAHMGPSFLNCSYSGVNVESALASGGFVGDAYAQGNSTVPSFIGLGISKTNDNSGHYASITMTDSKLKLGMDSTIVATAKGGVSGGLFGATGMQNIINDSTVNSKTGLAVLNSQNISKIVLHNVSISASTKDETLITSSRVNNGYNNGKWATAGGLIGRLGSVNYSYFFDALIEDCTIKTGNKADNEYSGGIVGVGYTNTKLTIQRCSVVGSENSEKQSFIGGKNAGGFLGYGYQASNFNLNLSDCLIENTTINGENSSGGFVGYGTSKYYFYNSMIKNTSIIGETASRLIGNTAVSNHDFFLYASGISIYVDPNNKDIKMPSQDVNTTDYNGYIAYADYSGINTVIPGQKSPYVTVNPNYLLEGVNKTITGDAVKIQSATEDRILTVASSILVNQNSGVLDSSKLNLVSYSGISSSIINGGLPEISTFYAVQGCGPDDLPVLTVKSGDVSVIEDYFNVITNGGYEKAKVITKNATDDADKVLDMKVEVYSYEKNGESGAFALKTKEALTNEPASVYIDNGDIKVLGNSYDNTRNRFSLVEATFKVTINGELRTYTVSIPVVVIRELRYDFMATLTYGAEFQKNVYNDLENHVLESAGNPITAYLSYSYNREKGDYVPYDWQSYMESGGSMLNIDKELIFGNGLPEGTQLILVDCQDGNRAYQYQVASGGVTRVQLSSFKPVTGEEKFNPSMADALGVTVSPAVNDGKFVITSYRSQATVKVNGTYYRLYEDGDDGARFNLVVPDLEVIKTVENYYLLMNVPKQQGSDYFLNGNIKSKLVWNMPNSGTQVHRYDETIADDASNTESTYQIYSGYQQTLESLATAGEAINLLDTNQKMQVAFKDTITFSSEQAYGEDDSLFAKFNISLKKFMSSQTNSDELQFAVGTSGTVHFYIQDSSGKYYVLEDTVWTTKDTEKEAASYEWVSQGSDMELMLSNNGKEALDIACVRQKIMGDDKLQSKIIITAKMDVVFNDQDVINATVPASDQNGTDIWAQLHYVAILSAHASSLDHSNNRLSINDNAYYYRSVRYAAVLSLDASLIDQLGVNPLEQVEDYMEFYNGKESAHIELNATLDLKNLPDYEKILKKSKEIGFSLSLEKRSGGDTYNGIDDVSDLIGFSWKDGSEGINWQIEQSQFVEKGELKVSDLYSDGRFSFPLNAYVYVEPRVFANYKINLTVSFVGDNNEPLSVEVDTTDAYVVYTYASIKPTFYTFSSDN